VSKIADDIARLVAAQEKYRNVQDALKRASEQAKAMAKKPVVGAKPPKS